MARAKVSIRADEFIAALSKALTEATDIEQLFAIWERNVDTVRAINKQTNRSTPRGVIARNLVAQLKRRAIALAKQSSEPSVERRSKRQRHRPKIDKSVLALSEPKRIRSKEHLRFVAQQPCVICGRTPAHAHHIRYAQPRGLALKVSDEFTVPLCAIHHSENHATGDERRWWHERKIDPLAIAQQLWARSRPKAETYCPPMNSAQLGEGYLGRCKPRSHGPLYPCGLDPNRFHEPHRVGRCSSGGSNGVNRANRGESPKCA